METTEKLIDATLLGITFHPELRGNVSASASKDIKVMLWRLVKATRPDPKPKPTP